MTKQTKKEAAAAIARVEADHATITRAMSAEVDLRDLILAGITINDDAATVNFDRFANAVRHEFAEYADKVEGNSASEFLKGKAATGEVVNKNGDIASAWDFYQKSDKALRDITGRLVKDEKLTDVYRLSNKVKDGKLTISIMVAKADKKQPKSLEKIIADAITQCVNAKHLTLTAKGKVSNPKAKGAVQLDAITAELARQLADLT